MSAISKLSQKTGIKYRVTINMAGIRPFSRNFKTKKTAVAWEKKTEGDLEAARVEGNNIARNLTLSTLITELVNSRTMNQATVICLCDEVAVKKGYLTRDKYLPFSERTGVVISERYPIIGRELVMSDTFIDRASKASD